MQDEVRLDAEQAAIANRIVEIDRRLDELDRAAEASIEWGLRGSGSGTGALDRDRLERRDGASRAELTDERRELAARLRASVEGPANG